MVKVVPPKSCKHKAADGQREFPLFGSRVLCNLSNRSLLATCGHQTGQLIVTSSHSNFIILSSYSSLVTFSYHQQSAYSDVIISTIIFWEEAPDRQLLIIFLAFYCISLDQTRDRSQTRLILFDEILQGLSQNGLL